MWTEIEGPVVVDSSGDGGDELTLRVAIRCQICGRLLVEVARVCAGEPKGHPHVRCASLSCARVMPAKWAACIRVPAMMVDGVERRVSRIVVEREGAS